MVKQICFDIQKCRVTDECKHKPTSQADVNVWQGLEQITTRKSIIACAYPHCLHH